MKYYFGLGISLELPSALKGFERDYVPHALAGGCIYFGGRVSTPREDEEFSFELQAWRLLYQGGLIGFPLSSRLPHLIEWARHHSYRLIALIVWLRMLRMCEQLTDRHNATIALGILFLLLSSLSKSCGIPPDQIERPPLPPPRASGVDPFGLFAPLC